jgi:nitrous oxide reductase
MNEQHTPPVSRRTLLRAAVLVGVAAGTAGATSNTPDAAIAAKADDRGKRRSQYQPNAVEVQTFYRVNSYPRK